jgi:monoamine oxidase
VTQTNVAVVGGGLAGLCAARRLRAAAIDFVLIEARDRLGGRILSVDETGAPSVDGFDLGPSWYWPRTQPALGVLIGELGLVAFPQHSDGDVVFERMSRAQRYHSAPQEPQSMRLVGGSAALVHALAHDLPTDRLMLGASVKALTLTDAGVEVSFARADGTAERLTFTHVIAALPPRLLEATMTFMPALAPVTVQRWRDTPTWMAPHAKFLARYDRPFWRDAKLSGTAQSMVGPMAEIHDATTASGAAALFGFIGVDAERRAALGEATLTHACLEQLARIFGAEARAPRATLIKDWAADPLTATASDRAPSGHLVPDHDAWVTGPWSERLVLAGSETSAFEPGYLAGAVAAAERAVTELLGHAHHGARAHRAPT